MRDYSKELGPTPNEERLAFRRYHVRRITTMVSITTQHGNGTQHGSPKDVKHRGHRIDGTRIR